MEQSVTIAADKRNTRKQDDGMQLIQHQRVKSETLLVGGRELVIEHAGRDYRLRITNKGKLILTA